MRLTRGRLCPIATFPVISNTPCSGASLLCIQQIVVGARSVIPGLCRACAKTRKEEGGGIQQRNLAPQLCWLSCQPSSHSQGINWTGSSPVVPAACSLTARRSRTKAFSPAWGVELARRRWTTGERSRAAKRGAPRRSWRCGSMAKNGCARGRVSGVGVEGRRWVGGLRQWQS